MANSTDHVALAKCRVAYLGYTTVTGKVEEHPGTEFLQSPLKERYPANAHAGIDSCLTVFSSGLYMQCNDSPNTVVWFPMKTLFMCAALQYVEKGTTGVDKFIPLNDPRSTGPHPPLFALAIRRDDNKDKIECHAFIAKNSTAAMALVHSCTHAYSEKSGWRDKMPPAKIIDDVMRKGFTITEKSKSFAKWKDETDFSSMYASRESLYGKNSQPPTLNKMQMNAPSSMRSASGSAMGSVHAHSQRIPISHMQWQKGGTVSVAPTYRPASIIPPRYARPPPPPHPHASMQRGMRPLPRQPPPAARMHGMPPPHPYWTIGYSGQVPYNYPYDHMHNAPSLAGEYNKDAAQNDDKKSVKKADKDKKNKKKDGSKKDKKDVKNMQDDRIAQDMPPDYDMGRYRENRAIEHDYPHDDRSSRDVRGRDSYAADRDRRYDDRDPRDSRRERDHRGNHDRRSEKHGARDSKTRDRYENRSRDFEEHDGYRSRDDRKYRDYHSRSSKDHRARGDKENVNSRSHSSHYKVKRIGKQNPSDSDSSSIESDDSDDERARRSKKGVQSRYPMDDYERRLEENKNDIEKLARALAEHRVMNKTPPIDYDVNNDFRASERDVSPNQRSATPPADYETIDDVTDASLNDRMVHRGSAHQYNSEIFMKANDSLAVTGHTQVKSPPAPGKGDFRWPYQ